MPKNLFSLLKNISELISKQGEYNSVLQQIVNMLAENLGVEVCSIYEYINTNDKLLLVASYGLDQEAINQITLSPGVGITGKCFKDNKVINVGDIKKNIDFHYFSNIGEDKFMSFLAVPLNIGGRRLGVLTMQCRENKPFNNNIIDMAKSLSSQLANYLLSTQVLEHLAIARKSLNDASLEGKEAVIKNLDNIFNDKVKEKASIDGTEQQIFSGVAANNGVAAGKAFLFNNYEFDKYPEPEFLKKDAVQKELEIFRKALELTKKKTLDLENRALTLISEADASIFNVHLLFLEDKTLINQIHSAIEHSNFSAEYAVTMVFFEFEKMFLSLPDETFRERVMDLKDVMIRLLESVKFVKSKTVTNSSLIDEKNTFDDSDQNIIIVAKELLPSDLLRMPIDNIAGIVCEKGGITAHMSILSKALNIPALLGVRNIYKNVKEDEVIYLDCYSEKLYIHAEDTIREHYSELINSKPTDEDIVPCENLVTVDGHKVNLFGNISLICETDMLDKYHAQGIGLYRTEFLYMIRDNLPIEQDQVNVYSRILESTDGTVTIRVLDAGGDKPLPYIDFPNEDNPALGFRGVRMLLKRPDIFRTQLRAILRAGMYGKIRILIPMISSESEVLEVKNEIEIVKDQLEAENVPFTKDYEFGIMLEVPSAVFDLKSIGKYVDFMSIGSNDLLQYIFATDRGNELFAGHPDDCLNPIFLRIIKRIGDYFIANPDKKISICGEMASNIYAIPLLIGANILDLSMPPVMIPQVAKIIQHLDLEKCQRLLKKCIGLRGSEQVKATIIKMYKNNGIEI
ncbi:phosphoenolpyruvate--protein phosphotransferase [Lentisphaerota bacterium WC36G]|nr:phosphoenolpyruvate--protein phosphotransferase [Lentisphaerae bacterium WC36]